ncbi:hypothetical protein [Streptomyces sp. NPDC088256]|uniref:hypothetical protein n=1 Tax=Streptomyces sp. NPDC088256 TaxID=3365848 RepID=UPI0037FC022E
MSTAPDVRYKFLTEVHAGDDRSTIYLGGTLAASPRLALRWLRGQADRLANGLDPDPGSPWIPPGALRPVSLADPHVPSELRAWANDDERQVDALHQLATGGVVEFVARDRTGWYGLAAYPLLIPEPMQASGVLTSA